MLSPIAPALNTVSYFGEGPSRLYRPLLPSCNHLRHHAGNTRGSMTRKPSGVTFLRLVPRAVPPPPTQNSQGLQPAPAPQFLRSPNIVASHLNKNSRHPLSQVGFALHCNGARRCRMAVGSLRAQALCTSKRLFFGTARLCRKCLKQRLHCGNRTAWDWKFRCLLCVE